MGHLTISDPSVRAAVMAMPTARGRGIHADELDSAFDAIAPYLSPQAYRTLEHENREWISQSEQPRRNPPAEDEEELASGRDLGTGVSGKQDATVYTRELYPIAMLVTGQWGVYTPLRGFSMQLPVPARENPRRPIFGQERHGFRNTESFWHRMHALHAECVWMAALADQRYEAKRKRPRPWVSTLLSIARAVKFLLDQQEAWEKRGVIPSIFDRGHSRRFDAKSGKWLRRKMDLAKHGSLGLPFGMKWGVLAAKGNKKLPFVAYSEAPMVSCPGAGACGVYDINTDTGTAAGGYCYSFKAWRYPSAFGRQILNTLANYADLEFAIMARAGKEIHPSASVGPDGQYMTREEIAQFSGKRSLPVVGTALEKQQSLQESYRLRVSAAIEAMQLPPTADHPYGFRLWPQFVKLLVVKELSKRLLAKDPAKRVKAAFVRLFVDGDIGNEATIVSWMQAIWDTSEGQSEDRLLQAAAVKAGIPVTDRNGNRVLGRIEWYGYTKCWSEFVNVADSGYKFPPNYIVNMSDASVYANDKRVEERMRSLPITRGYFDAIKLGPQITKLNDLYKKLPKDPGGAVILNKPQTQMVPWSWSEARIEGFLKASGVETEEEARELLGLEPKERFSYQKPKFKQPKPPKSAGIEYEQWKKAQESFFGSLDVQRKIIEAIRRKALEMYVEQIVEGKATNPGLLLELSRDLGYSSPQEAEADARQKYEKRLRKYQEQVRKAKSGQGPMPKKKVGEYKSPLEKKKALKEKALSLLLHEALQGVQGSTSGSCPLVCGNCSDLPYGNKDGVHRCASKTVFKGVHIHIGLH